jgi:threonyl-tRNA synthetase
MTADKAKVDASSKPEVPKEVPSAAKPEAGADASQVTISAPKPGYARPVMIHRAIAGSFERFIAILTEHFGGKWPFWLSPRQVLVIPIVPALNDYCEEVQKIFRAQGFHADIGKYQAHTE